MTIRLVTAATVMAFTATAQQAALDHFETKVRPVLAAKCYACHGASTPTPQGGLRLDSADGVKKGGNSGPVVQPGDPEHSLLIRAIRHTDKNLKMPPGKPIAAESIAEIERWIRDGAPMPADRSTAAAPKKASLWSLQKPRAVEPPAVKGADWARNAIDQFILARLEAKDLAPSEEADRRTLIRRASYDLTGLPPSAEETDKFVSDRSPDAYERLVDRLLASPHYGERWARHWLDVARYSDSVNDSVNAGQRYPWSYTYRDWVIRALNEDMPYDKFVLYQLAADRLQGIDRRHLAALGFLSLGREFPKSYPETVDDRIDAVTRGLMGFTVACARCHDHKYDPIPTKDYYSLYSVLANIRTPKELPLLGKPAPLSSHEQVYHDRLENIRRVQQEYRVRRHAEMVAFFKTQTAEYLIAARDAEGLSNTDVEELVRDRQLNSHVLARWRKQLRESKATGEPLFRAWHAAAAIPEKEFASKWPAIRSESFLKGTGTLRDVAVAYARELEARKIATPADVPLDEFELIYTEGDSNNTRSIKVRYNTMLALAAYDGAAPRAMAIEDVPHPEPAHVFVRGNPSNPGALTPPRFLSCMGGNDEQPFRDGSGRLELARAIVDPGNPLTARVIVNRVWMHHFGSGLVRTPSDFGFRGDPPTHPELLDYLTVKFVESGWSLKQLHRLIMTSATYRQASAAVNESARKVDPENQLLWRMNRRRMEIEALRDAMLSASGRLDLTAGGAPFVLTAQPSIPRRTVYGFIERGRVPAMLSAFDFASPDQHAPMRYVTTVPQQALFFLNSPFVAEQSEYLAERSAGATAQERIRKMYRFAFGRDPEKWEMAAGLRFVERKEDAAGVSQESPWQYGIGEVREDRVAKFVAFPVFAADRWQGGGALPAPAFGKALMRAAGGEPGEKDAVVRRWVSPVSGKLTIEGTLRHNQPAVPFGDGVRGRIVSSRHGELASWSVNGSAAETKLTGISVEKGDTIDFVVDARRDPENDGFNWAPVVKAGDQSWNAQKDFAGPAVRRPGVWARYAHVLLETNEFAFVD